MKPRHALPRRPLRKPDPSLGGDMPGVGRGAALGADLGEALGADLGVALGGGLTEAEVDYLMGHEWAACAEDIFWRRSKLGLHFSEQDEGAARRLDRAKEYRHREGARTMTPKSPGNGS